MADMQPGGGSDMLLPPTRGEEEAADAANPRAARPAGGQDVPAIYLRSKRNNAAGRQAFAALDLGTNNCRLLIARAADGDGDNIFQVIDAFSRVVRLGEGLVQTGRLSDAAMDRTIAALAACAEKLARRGVHQVRSVATEACRIASNGPEFVRRVYQETGLALDVITPAEEARLAVLGCQTLIEPTPGRTLVFDIGGGSTELVLLERGRRARSPLRMLAWLSIPWGVVSLGESEPRDAGSPAARLEAYQRMKARVSAHLKPLRPLVDANVQLLGASGTVTTLASLNMGLAQYDRRRVDGSEALTAELVALSHDLAIKSPPERAAVPGVGHDRADLVVAGSAILEALIDLGRSPRLRVADRGIREGILRSMFAREEAGRPERKPA